MQAKEAGPSARSPSGEGDPCGLSRQRRRDLVGPHPPRSRRLCLQKDRVKLDAITYEASIRNWRGKICIRSGRRVYDVALIASMIKAQGEAETETWLRPQGQSRAQARDVRTGVDEGRALPAIDAGRRNAYYMGAMLKNNKTPRAEGMGETWSTCCSQRQRPGTRVNVWRGARQERPEQGRRGGRAHGIPGLRQRPRCTPT